MEEGGARVEEGNASTRDEKGRGICTCIVLLTARVRKLMKTAKRNTEVTTVNPRNQGGARPNQP